MAMVPSVPTTDRFRSLFESLFDADWNGGPGGIEMLRAPHADVQETGDSIRVLLEVPGMGPEDIRINLESNVLTVSGEKRQEQEEEGLRWHLSERRYGRFSRSFVLPREVEHDRIEARLEDGVLHLSVPKTEKAKPRRIEIQGGGKRRLVGKK